MTRTADGGLRVDTVTDVFPGQDYLLRDGSAVRVTRWPEIYEDFVFGLYLFAGEPLAMIEAVLPLADFSGERAF